MSNFENLSSDKQMRILNAAYLEFAEQGYEKASTNAIVKRASIGKGLLFYYFKNKQDLFYYLIESGIQFIKHEYLDQVLNSETDFIKRYKQIAKLKLKAYKKNPHVFNFFGSFYLNNDVELPESIQKQLKDMRNDAYDKLLNHIDYSVFRDDLDEKRTLQLMMWTMDGYEKSLTDRLKTENLTKLDYAPLFEEFYTLLDHLKQVYYK